MSIEVYFILLFIGFITFFFWRWLFKKLIKNTRNRKMAIWASTIIGTPIIYTSIILLFIAALFYYPEYKFDPEKWKNSPEKRYELTDDLINRKLLIGKSKNEVAKLLGIPLDFKSNVWVYVLGFVPALFNIDPDILEISFKNGRVIGVKQRNT